MADQEAVTPLFAGCIITILTSLERSHRAQCVGTNVPHDTWTVRHVQAVADRVCAGIEQGLPAAVTMILDAITTAAVLIRPVIDVTEPRAVFERQPADPLVLHLCKGLHAQIRVEILTVGKTRQTIVAFGIA